MEFGAGNLTVAGDVSHSLEAGRSPCSEVEADREEQKYTLVTDLCGTAQPLTVKALENWLTSDIVCG